MSTLEGATTLPAPYTECANASEFAALWNSLDEGRREELFSRLRSDQKRAADCFIRMHDETILVLERRLAEVPTAEGDWQLPTTDDSHVGEDTD